LGDVEVPFMTEIVRTIRRESDSKIHVDVDNQVKDIFDVFVAQKEDEKPFDAVNFVSIGSLRYYARATNLIALLAINGISVDRVLDPVPEEKLVAILKALQADPNAQPAADASEAEKAAYKVKPEIITMYMQGRIKSEKYYTQVLNVLATTKVKPPQKKKDDSDG